MQAHFSPVSAASELVVLASELVHEEETLRKTVAHSAPVLYAEWAAERADKLMFTRHPCGRYAAGAAGAFLGLYIQKNARLPFSSRR